MFFFQRRNQNQFEKTDVRNRNLTLLPILNKNLGYEYACNKSSTLSSVSVKQIFKKN